MLYTKSIRKNTDFKRMYYRSKFKIGYLTVIYIKPQKNNFAYLGVTVSKKVGNAVTRNRARRVIIAAYSKLEKLENLRGYSIVIVARKNCASAGMLKVFEELKKNLNFLKNITSNKKVNLKSNLS